MLAIGLLLMPCRSPRAAAPPGPDHAAAGARLYRDGKLEAALAELTAAYFARPDPALLLALGRCHLALGAEDAAAFFFRGYLEQAGAGADRTEVERLLAEAQARKAARAAASSAAASRPPAKPIYRRWWLWTTLGVAAAGAGIGLAAGLVPRPLPVDQLGTIDDR